MQFFQHPEISIPVILVFGTHTRKYDTLICYVEGMIIQTQNMPVFNDNVAHYIYEAFHLLRYSFFRTLRMAITCDIADWFYVVDIDKAIWTYWETP